MAAWAETARAVFASGAGLLALMVGCVLILVNGHALWPFLTISATTNALTAAVSLWRVVRIERTQPDIVLALTRLFWRPECLAWPRGATTP